jgi:tRNA threonylcarbamoyladenosine biosynthesis protein TsaE
MEFIYELEDIASVAEIVVAQNPKSDSFLWWNGCWKTTFIKQLCKTLGVTEGLVVQPFL